MELGQIRIAKDKGEFVKQLTVKDGDSGPFQTYADVMLFAAVLGAKQQRRVALTEISKNPSPINIEVFLSRGYDGVIKLLAFMTTQDLKSLSNEEDSVNQRHQILEEYANGGLEVLQSELRGNVDYTNGLLLMLKAGQKVERETEEFDLSRFLPM